MTPEKRKIQKFIDGGGPIVLGKTDQNSESPNDKGLVVDISFCDNPQCYYAHFWALDIDEKFNEAERSCQNGTLALDQKDAKSITNTECSGSLHIHTGEIELHEQSGLKENVDDLLSRISYYYKNGDLKDILERRYKSSKKIDKDAWKEKDWSWWQSGELLAWSEVYPNDPDFLLDDFILAEDLYCITPGCMCNDICVSFTDYKTGESFGAVRIDASKWTINDMDAEEKYHQKLRQLWLKLKEFHPDYKKILKKRQKAIRIPGKEIAQMSGNMPKKAITNKVGRNDPCPCGSGKKYKKCCLS